ncbi:MAG: hypothetical protein P1U36_10635 [Legionellaceae bacterium]|nr:hypothetical protein [Legionellaceae bacterium]
MMSDEQSELPTSTNPVIREFFSSERRFMNKVGCNHDNFTPYLSHAEVSKEDKFFIRQYLAQSNTLNTLYKKLDFTEGHESTILTAQELSTFCNHEDFKTYQNWLIGMVHPNTLLNDLVSRYKNIIPINTDAADSFNAVLILPAQRILKYKSLYNEIQKRSSTDEEKSSMEKPITYISSRANLSNGMMNKKRYPAWNANTTSWVSGLLDQLKTPCLPPIERINALTTMINSIQSGAWGSEQSDERLSSARDVAHVAFELIKAQVQQTESVEEIADLTEKLIEINQAIKTPAMTGQLGRRGSMSKFILGGESQKTGSITIQKQTREYLTQDSPLVQAYIRVFNNSSDSSQSSGEILKLNQLLVNKVIVGPEEKNMEFKQLVAQMIVDNPVDGAKETNIEQNLENFLDVVRNAKKIDMDLAKKVAEIALNQVIKWMQSDPIQHQFEKVHTFMQKISDEIQSSPLQRAVKHVSGQPESKGEVKTVQKRFRAFLANPREYIKKATNSSGHAASAPPIPDNTSAARALINELREKQANEAGVEKENKDPFRPQ